MLTSQESTASDVVAAAVAVADDEEEGNMFAVLFLCRLAYIFFITHFKVCIIIKR